MSRPIPLGVEVLVRKAAVDPEFRAILLARRAEAAAEIDLVLEPAEAAMLAAVPAAQLETIIDRTTVPQEHRRAFLGRAAAAMLAALGAMTPAAAAAGVPGGFGSGGVRADFPAPPPAVASVESRVCQLIAKALDRETGEVRRDTRLRADLGVTPEQMGSIHKALQEEFKVTLSLATLKTLGTVDEVIRQVEATREVQQAVTDALARRSGIPSSAVEAEKSLSEDMKLTPAQLAAVRQELSTRFRVFLVWDSFRQQETVGDLIDFVAGAVRRRQEAATRPEPPPTRGIQPDVPAGTFGIQPDLPPQRGPVRPQYPPAGGMGGVRG